MYKFARGRHDCWYLPKLYMLSESTQTGSKSSSAIVFVCVCVVIHGGQRERGIRMICHKYEGGMSHMCMRHGTHTNEARMNVASHNYDETSHI